jgi:AcrR family transcriptional regulator
MYTVTMNAPRTARERARAELTREILTAAKRQLGEVGPTALSLRAVARELGMASSAVYRYFASRDELLTALLLEGFGDIGAAAERALAAREGDAPVERWLAVWRAVREWALAHRHEFALLFGTPVPGYTAPQETGPAAGRMPLTLVAIAAEARAAGALAEVPGPKCDPALLDDAVQEIAAAVGGPPEDAAGLVLAWNRLVGMIAFELHGHFHRVITDYEAFFEHAARVEATRIGLD